MSAGSIRLLEWEGCLNVRDLGGHPLEAGGTTAYGVVFRADNVRNLTEAGRSRLLDRGVRRVVDLRWQEELDEDPAVELAVEHVHVPVLGLRRPADRYARFASIAAGVEDDAAFTRRLYGEYLEEFAGAFAAAVEAVASAPGPAVVHCTAGKDRTGLVVALLLRLAGVGIEAIASDYALTDVRPLLRRGLADGMSPDEVRTRTFLLGAPREGMAGVLGDLETRHGSVLAYLQAAGLSASTARAVRRRLGAEPPEEGAPS